MWIEDEAGLDLHKTSSHFYTLVFAHLLYSSSDLKHIHVFINKGSSDEIETLHPSPIKAVAA
jgi:hypothetical protein